MATEGKLVLWDCGDDWYSVIREPYRQINGASIEGNAEEMLALAEAIESRSAYSAKRCAVDARTDRVQLWSPRNSVTESIVSRADAEHLAADIRSRLGALDPSTALDAIRERWGAAHNGFASVGDLDLHGARAKLRQAIADIHALMLVADVLRAAGEAEDADDATFDAVSDALWAKAREVAGSRARGETLLLARLRAVRAREHERKRLRWYLRSAEPTAIAGRLRADFPTDFLASRPDLTQLLVEAASSLEAGDEVRR